MLTIVPVADPPEWLGGSIERILGYAASELQGAEAWAPVHPEDLPRLQNVIEACGRTLGESLRIEYRMQRKNGAHIHVETLLSNCLDDPDAEFGEQDDSDGGMCANIECAIAADGEIQCKVLNVRRSFVPLLLPDVSNRLLSALRRPLGEGEISDGDLLRRARALSVAAAACDVSNSSFLPVPSV